MQLPFRNNPQAALAKAEAALSATEQRIAALQADRQLTLRDSDDVAAVQVIDAKIAAEQGAAVVHRDRIEALTKVVHDQRAAEAERAHAVAVAVVEQRGAEEIELARQVEADMRRFADSWNKLIGWRARMTRDWPVGLPLPPTDAFIDLSGLMHEAGQLYYGLGNPSAERRSSLPRAVAPSGVQGTAPVGLATYVAGAVAAFVARLKRTPVQAPNDESEAA